MNSDYRLSLEEASKLNPLGILDAVSFNIYDNCPDLRDDESIGLFSSKIDPIVFQIFSAWMVRGYLVVGGVVHIFEQCCKKIILNALIGFRMLKVEPIADIIVFAFKIFPNEIMPERHSLMFDWIESCEGFVNVQKAMDRGDFNPDKFADSKYNCDDWFEENRFLFVKDC